MDIATLDRPIADLVTELMVSDLAVLDAALDTASALLKRRKETLHAILARRFEDEARKQLVAAKKDTGTATIITNGITIKAEFKKTVEWDQTKLLAALNAMAPDDAKHYGKVTLAVEERKFTAAPPAVQKALADARTVKPSKPSFAFKLDNVEA